MSTTFKQIDNSIEASKNSPKKSFVLTSSQQLSQTSGAIDSESDNSSMDKEEILKMEIKQLERENKFLKKKIAELTSEINGEKVTSKKSRVSGKGLGTLKEDGDPIQITVEYFHKEINGLLHSFRELFKVDFTCEETEQLASDYPITPESLISHKQYDIFKKHTLARRLQRIALESEEKQYPLLISLFSELYTSKEQFDKNIRERVDQLSDRAIQLNKMILDNANRRKSHLNLKSSCIRSVYTVDDPAEKSEKFGENWNIRKIPPLMKDEEKRLEEIDEI